MKQRSRVGAEDRQRRDDTPLQVLLAGESWVIHSTHIKGFDSFTTSEYAEGATYLIDSLRQSGINVTFMPNHVASRQFPTTLEETQRFHVIILSDIGSNTLYIHPDTFSRSEPKPDRVAL